VSGARGRLGLGLIGGLLGLLAACGGAGYDREPRAHGRAVPGAETPPQVTPAPLAPTEEPESAKVTPADGGGRTAPPEVTPSEAAPFPPAAFGPPHSRTAKPGDGTWRVLAPGVTTTTVHPDPVKGFVEVAIVALDTSLLELELVAGTDEPENPSIGKDKRPGIVAPPHLPRLVIATNGGYKARHGRHGMRVGGDVFVPAKAESCTIARLADDRIHVGSWAKVANSEATLKWFRQGPACLIEGGVLHPDLAHEYGRKKWGAAEDGKKDIRRSAYALGPGGALYFAIGEWTTADLLAAGLRAAGVTDAVQMDINWSFTRFVLYERPGPEPVATSPILEKLKFGPREYWQKASERDFFYLHAK
jgi:hypothetical protein